MPWDVSSAIANLRSLLGDGETDKFEFKTLVAPQPDSVSTRFFVTQTRVVPNTLEVYHNGVQVSPSGAVDWTKGTFSFAPSGLAPSGQLEASFYYQWFTDEELVRFLDQAAQMLSLQATVTQTFTDLFEEFVDSETLTEITIEIGLQPTLMQFAIYAAYSRKAAEWADALTASAAGYTMDLSKRGPNWTQLAKAAMEQAKAALDLFTSNPLSSKRTILRFVSFRLPPYQNP